MGNIISQKVKDVFAYFIHGYFSYGKAEESLQKYLIYTFSIVSFVFVFTLGIIGVSSSSYESNVFIFGAALLLLINLTYLRVTNNYVYSAYIIVYIFFVFMLYLIYSGGYANTGPLWIYALPPIALYIQGLKKGFIDLSIFLIIMLVLFFYPNHYFLDTNYTEAFKVRIVLSFLLLVSLSLLYEYSKEKSLKKMHKVQSDLEFFLKIDPLTGLFNRRGYHASLSKIGDKHGVMLMCDIDYFKSINDTYGHEAGDYVIQEVAQCIQENIRKDDIGIRWGGEEFLIFLSETNMNNGYLVAEKLRKSIESLNINYTEAITIKATISIGIALINNETTIEQAIKNADNAMYISKSGGRNKTSKF